MISTFQPIIILILTGVYFLFILVPGYLLYILYYKSNSYENLDFLSFIFFINVVGFSIYILVTWILLLLGVFYLWTVGATLLAIISVLMLITYKYRDTELVGNSFIRFSKNAISRTPKPRKYDMIFIFLGIFSTLFIFIPVFEALFHGSLIAGDTATFAKFSNLFVSSHKWPDIATFLHKYYTSSSSPPGISLLYTLFSLPVGVNAIYATYPVDILLTWFSILGIYLVTVRITSDRLVSSLLSIFWIFGMLVAYFGSISNVTSLIAASGTIPDLILTEILVAFLLLLFLEKTSLRNVGSGVFITSLTLISIVLSNPLTFVLVLFPYFVFLIYVFLKVSKMTYLAYFVFPAIAVYLTFVPYLTKLGGLTGLRIGSQSLNDYSIALLLMALILICTVAFYLVSIIFVKEKRPSINSSESVLFLAIFLGSALVYFTFFYGQITERLLGIGSFQVAIINSMFVVFLVALLYLFLSREPKLKDLRKSMVKIVTVIILVLFIVAGIGYYTITEQTQSLYTHEVRFDQSEFQAATWINSHLKDNGTVLLNGNPGNVYSIITFRDFIDLPTVAIAEYVLNNSINFNPYPFNLPYLYGYLMISWPNYTNSMNAFAEIGYKYFIFQSPYNEKDIVLYSELPYMKLIYNNSEIYVFEFNPKALNTTLLINPADYTNSSANVVDQRGIYPPGGQYGGPLLQVTSVFTKSTIVTATMPPGSSNSTFVDYNLSVQNLGSYKLLIHTYVYHQQSQSISVFVNDVFVKTLAFQKCGWSFTPPLELNLSQHTNTLRLVFSSNCYRVDYLNPIDYLLLTGLTR